MHRASDRQGIPIGFGRGTNKNGSSNHHRKAGKAGAGFRRKRRRRKRSILEVCFAIVIVVALMGAFASLALLDRAHMDPAVPVNTFPNHKTKEVLYTTAPFGSLLPFGFVFSELAARVLSRHIAESNVLIVGENTTISNSFAAHAQREGHTVYRVGNDTTLDEWWDRSIKPNWIILAIIDSGCSVLQADVFLKQSTVTYFVSIANSRKVDPNQYVFSGLDTAEALLRHGYKLQTLLTSHYHVPSSAREVETFQLYGPNALMKTRRDVEQLLRWGADAAAYFGGKDFEVAIFATQGLDLAIPSRRLYISDESRVKTKASGWTQINMYKPLVFLDCPRRDGIKIQFRKNGFHIDIPSWSRWRKLLTPTDGVSVAVAAEKVVVSQTRPMLHNIRADDGTVYLWHSSPTPSSSEAVCVYQQLKVACSTRILPKIIPTVTSRKSSAQRNILLVLIDPISRKHFDRTMPQTKQTLEELKLVRFHNYSVVGPNSGPNQAALYSGSRLRSRDGISVRGNNGKVEWLWDRLNSNGYATFKAEDACIENSNMLQSLRPNTTHGEALNQYFCFDFDRPNCLGGKLAAKHLIQHATEFIQLYDSTTPWAAFVHFVDTHEDTMMLSSLIDSHVANFLKDLHQKGHLSKAWISFTSDHGLHYGPFFQATDGEQERAEALLYMGAAEDTTGDATLSLRRNSDLFVTPFDVHQTLLQISLGENNMLQKDLEGISLLTPLPSLRRRCESTELIPPRFCKPRIAAVQLEPTRMNNPPSVLSFFADISIQNRQFPDEQRCSRQPSPLFTCYCMTSHRDWFSCAQHPWGRSWRKNFPTEYDHEYFAALKCDSEVLRIDTRVAPQSQFLDRPVLSTRRSKIPNKQSGTDSPSSMNVLFLEIDSVSRSYADRHLPLTRALLKEHRPDSRGNCKRQVCAVEFPLSAVSGPNSIANQIPSLSGCLVARFHQSCFSGSDDCTNLERTEQQCLAGSFPRDPLSGCNGRVDDCCTFEFPRWNESLQCKDMSLLESNLQLLRRGPRRELTWCPRVPNDRENVSSPWLFDLAREHGYVTAFGEEFCFHGSKFVPQDMIFPLDVDYPLHELFCRLKSAPYYSGPREGPHVCIDKGEEGLDTPLLAQLEAIWDAYPDTPKFGFVNIMAAHNYDASWRRAIMGAEKYDNHLALFLAKMVRRENTLIVIRGDHGLQGGPTTVDYSVQIEHRQPWFELVIPGGAGIESMETLLTNANRLVTGFDLYRTVRAVIDPPGLSSAPIPDWSYDLLSTEIPQNRSCKDARVPSEFCPLMGVESKSAPQFGVCNSFDEFSDLFCSEKEVPIRPSERY